MQDRLERRIVGARQLASGLILGDSPEDSAPLYERIIGAVRHQIERGELRKGDRLPSSRQLAQEIGCARNTVSAAFDQLIAEGFLEGRHGSGTYVATNVTRPPDARPVHITPAWPMPQWPVRHDWSPLKADFRVGQPSVEFFPRIRWQRAWSWAARRPVCTHYGDPQGELNLRGAICSYQRRLRGLHAEPDGVVITNGISDAIGLICRLLIAPGDTVIVEEPCYPIARQAFQQAGAQIMACPVDGDGLQVEQILSTRAKLVYVTPSHQFPVGSRLSLDRRLLLLDWAQRHQGFILEDDYDGEFRFDVNPLPALASLTHSERVIYLGTFSKNLLPSLRVGFAIAVPSLAAALAKLKAAQDYHVSLIVQSALAQFIQLGDLDRYVHRMRRLYADKRKVLLRAISAASLPAAVAGLEAGLHAFVAFDSSVDIDKLVVAARDDGIWITDVKRYAAGPIRQHGLVLGFAAPSVHEINVGVQALHAT